MNLTITSIAPYFIIMSVLTLLAWALGQLNWTRQIAVQNDADPRFKPALESLRGILSASVFFHHALITYFYYHSGKWATPPSSFYALLGPSPVLIFFFLTGYLFWKKLLHTSPLLKAKQFYLSRGLRILPVYWAMVLILLGYAWVDCAGNLRESPVSVVKEILQWISVGLPFGNFPSINSFENTGQVLAGVYWTLRYEILFYLLLPLLAWFAVGKRTFILLILSLVMSFSFDRAHFDLNVIFYPVFELLTSFAVFFKAGWGFGILAAYLRKQSTPFLAKCFSSKTAAILGLLAVSFHFLNPPRIFSLQHSLLLFPLFLIITFENNLFGLLTLKPLVFLGRISYSFYLSHGLFLYTGAKLYQHFALVSEMSPEQFWIFTLLCGCATLVWSTVLYYFVERPFFSNLKIST